MTTRGLYIFKHISKLGNAPAHSLFERINVRLNDDVAVPRSFKDYRIDIDDADLPEQIELIRRVG